MCDGALKVAVVIDSIYHWYMKKNFLLFFVLLFHLNLFAAENPAGVISLATKDVTIIAVDGSERSAKTGDHFYQNERITTPSGGKTQLLFRDQMTINLSQGSELKVDAFVYDPAKANDNKITTSIKKGAFKFISGKIATDNKKAMRVKTPKTQIAIRGTSAVGDIEENGQEQIILLDGEIEISSDQLSIVQLISQSGSGVTIDLDGNISTPVVLSDSALSNIFEKVNLTEESATVSSKDSQALISAVSKSMLEEGESELKKMFGEKAEFVETSLLEAANKVAEKSGDTSSISVGEVFSELSKNAELQKILFEEGADLTDLNKLDNVNVDGKIFSYMAAGYSRPEVLSASGVSSATNRQGTVTLNFNNITLSNNINNQGRGTGSGSAEAIVTVDLDNQQFSANLQADFTLGGNSYLINETTENNIGQSFVGVGSKYALDFQGGEGEFTGIYGSGEKSGQEFVSGDTIEYIDVIRNNVEDVTTNIKDTFVTLEIDLGATAKNEVYSSGLVEIVDAAGVINNESGNKISGSQEIVVD